MSRDMTKAQFERELARHGMKRELFGFVDVGGVYVYAANAGDNRRAQLAYLLRQQEKHERAACGVKP